MSRSIVPFVLLLMMSGCSPEPVSPEEPGPGGGGVEGAALRKHCVVAASSTEEDGNGVPVPRPTEPALCFHQFSEAIAFATGGRVQLAADATPADVDEALLRGAVQASSGLAPHVIAIEYSDENFGGSSLTVQSAASCETASVTLDLADPWRNSVSSARVFGGCNHAYHYESGGLKGARVDCGRGCSFVGEALNDRTSSLKWTR